jgi:hypothetical protein
LASPWSILLEGLIFPKPDVPHLNERRKQRRKFVTQCYTAIILNLVEKAVTPYYPNQKQLVVQLSNVKTFSGKAFPDYVLAFSEARAID